MNEAFPTSEMMLHDDFVDGALGCEEAPKQRTVVPFKGKMCNINRNRKIGNN